MKSTDIRKLKCIDEPVSKIEYMTRASADQNHEKIEVLPRFVDFKDNHIFERAHDWEDVHPEESSHWFSNIESFKVMIDNANDGICLVPVNMRHAYANKKYCDITGYNQNELKRISIVDLVTESERKGFQEILNLCSEDQINLDKNLTATFVRKNGAKFIMECSLCRSIWKGRYATALIVRDITINLEMVKSLKETNVHLSNHLDKIASELSSYREKLNQKQSELVSNKLELENVNKELMQTNRAMSFLAQNIAKKKKEVEQKIALTVTTKINPIIIDLKKKKSLQKYIAEFEVLSVYVNGLAPEADQYNKILSNLSTTEMRIASLIKTCMSSQKIADTMNISLETVKTHRKKIRRKLEINNSNINLTSYLRSIMAD